MSEKKVLFITTEISPYLPDTDMSLIARDLPSGIQERGREIRTFMPKFGLVNERRNQLHEVIRLSGLNIIINEADHQLVIKVASIHSVRMQVYFIDNDDFFLRKHILRDENGKEFSDNDERSIFYIRGVMETIKKLRWAPDIIHCHGCITALAPIYIKKHYKSDPSFKHAKVVYSLYSDDFKQPYNASFAKKAKIEGVSQNDLRSIKENPDFITISKLAIDFSDGIIIGSENVNPELVEYVKQKENKKFLPYQPKETYIDSINNFYNKLLSVQEIKK
ncbi:MAG: glycogen/starch synthase [Dysgonamonadaceae bacterium]|jgi:starch synthase|nr:glycogen/starch synthase [Dysgonamonadaceae bacterium]